MQREARPTPVPFHLGSSDEFENYICQVREKERSEGKKVEEKRKERERGGGARREN